jgi:hypothetical protein
VEKRIASAGDAVGFAGLDNAQLCPQKPSIRRRFMFFLAGVFLPALCLGLVVSGFQASNDRCELLCERRRAKRSWADAALELLAEAARMTLGVPSALVESLYQCSRGEADP